MRENTTMQQRFEAWLIDARVAPNFRKNAAGQYVDLDTEWLWLAYQRGAADRRAK